MEGLRIWIIEKKTNIPKLLREGNVDELCEIIKTLDFKNETYAIRIGIGGKK